jgi:hypothetical protein
MPIQDGWKPLPYRRNLSARVGGGKLGSDERKFLRSLSCNHYAFGLSTPPPLPGREEIALALSLINEIF